jgi:hypothetical protein
MRRWTGIALRDLKRFRDYCLNVLCNAMLHSPLMPMAKVYTPCWRPKTRPVDEGR